ncbi:MAG: 2-dehydropantoate 2-reductase [Clostridiales bacterium]|nr:2-dehydropantoate 2-reductase [Clostridiales bacterium]
MNYLIIGAGGTGGCLGAHMARGGLDVTLIARGQHLAALQSSGLTLVPSGGEAYTVPVQATDSEHYQGQPDVVFLCVKGYSLEALIPFLQRICNKDTVVVPILNIYGTGGRLQPSLPESLVTDGCIYVAASIQSPGVVAMQGEILRVVFGPRTPEEYRPVLKDIQADLTRCGVKAQLSRNIQRDALQKFSYVSPAAACGVYYDVKAEAMQRPGPERDTFAALIREIDALAEAMGHPFRTSMVRANLLILDALAPDASTSMQRDLWAGHESEIDGLIFEVVRLGQRYQVPTPTYCMVARKLGYDC